ncbi:MAG TPA: PA14 domain-containing protein [Saprospiraceae bacterium]|nr:PA14 domain-containing protein [Saprospiraceae bacterium]
MNIKNNLSLMLVGLIPALGLSQQGFQAEYFNGRNFDQKMHTRTDERINFVWNNVPPVAGMNPHVFSVRWIGNLKAPESGEYLFRAHVDDGIRVKLGGRTVIDAWDLHDSEAFMGSVYLHAGQEYVMEVEYFNALNEGEIQLFWQLPSEAPVFKGMFGYNDHPIDPSHIRLPNPPPAQASRLQPKPVQPNPKPAATPVQPVRQPKPALVSKDTLEKYLPKNVLFVKSKSILLPESEPELNRLAGFLKRNSRYKLRIEGHTDRVGNAEKNLILSRERAQSVADYLVQQGIDTRRITTIGYGDTRPLVLEAKNVPNEKNRRVEFFLEE